MTLYFDESKEERPHFEGRVYLGSKQYLYNFLRSVNTELAPYPYLNMEHLFEYIGARELKMYKQSIINDYSLVLNLKLPSQACSCVSVYKTMEYYTPLYYYALYISRDSSVPILLYFSDTTSNVLPHIVKYYIQNVDSKGSPIVEVAPHHGNSYHRVLALLRPRIIYVPRCQRHIPRRWELPRIWKMLEMRGDTKLYVSGHNTGVTIASSFP